MFDETVAKVYKEYYDELEQKIKNKKLQKTT